MARNDAAALAAADVSVAINSTSFILLNSDLQTLLELVGLAKHAFWRAMANFV
jgi:cation transport ATPase